MMALLVCAWASRAKTAISIPRVRGFKCFHGVMRRSLVMGVFLRLLVWFVLKRPHAPRELLPRRGMSETRSGGVSTTVPRLDCESPMWRLPADGEAPRPGAVGEGGDAIAGGAGVAALSRLDGDDHRASGGGNRTCVHRGRAGIRVIGIELRAPHRPSARRRAAAANLRPVLPAIGREADAGARLRGRDLEREAPRP